ncbi:MAG TPA: Spy/CpxP family protein refolding chaperone [Phenylobacterium sp.]|uniref:Spy/CpxP family protein refolding chaperone n=1 Tax=Phenylobacterium sp. TaxID=1871053 RepID=UPI002CA42DE7|nr:Spy/CpxP family protein refolding chaperone [Phenylobacterium sp.]HSV01684.1 Spy/CpxP family protein refolding chaperone [Phenylobacterium sp.]
MIRRCSYLFAGAAFALYAAAGAAAFAQPAPAPKGVSETVVRTVRDGEAHEVRVERDAAGKLTITRDGRTTMVDAHAMGDPHLDMAQHLRNLLQLRPSQEAALQAFVNASQPDRPMAFRSEDRESAETTPQRLADMERRLAAHDAAAHARIRATRAFYDQLDPAQKKAFDELHLAGGHMRMIHRIRMVGPMPHMPPMPPPPVPPVPPPPRL